MLPLFGCIIACLVFVAVVVMPFATYNAVRDLAKTNAADLARLLGRLERMERCLERPDLRQDRQGRPEAAGSAPLSTAVTRSLASTTPEAAEAPRCEAVSPPIPKLRPEPLPEARPAAGPPPLYWPAREAIVAEPARTATRHPALPLTPPRAPSRFEAAAKETLRAVWNWIIVGEEHVPAGVSPEFAVASQWLLRIGIVTILSGIGFFLKYSIDQGYLGPTARVGLTVITGLAMLIGGTRLLGGRYHALGQGLMGGGLAALYFAVFAAHQMFALIDAGPAFVLMAAITALGGGTAVVFDSMLVAVLGIVGGYATPFMLDSNATSLVPLFTYLLVLGAGVLGLCFRKNWPLVNLLAFIGTWALVVPAVWGSDLYTPDQFPRVFPFLVGYFLLFSTATFLFTIVRGTRSNLVDLVALLVNAAVFFAVGRRMIQQAFPQEGTLPLAMLALAMAAFYAAHVWIVMRRRTVDRDLVVSFLGLASFFVAITMPLLLSREWVTASWAIQAVAMLWMAERLGSRFLRLAAGAVLAIVVCRFFAIDLGGTFRPGAQPTEMPLADFAVALVGRIAAFGIPIACLGTASWFLRRAAAAEAATEAAAPLIGRGNDIGTIPGTMLLVEGLVVACVAMIGLYLHLEVDRTVGFLYPDLRLPMLTILWLAGCGFILGRLNAWGETVGVAALAAALSAVLLKLFCWDIPSWGLQPNGIYAGGWSPHDAAMRFVDFGAVAGFLVVLTALATTRRPLALLQHAAAVASVGTLLAWSTLEVNSFLAEHAPGLRAGGVSITWALFAIAFLVAGIRRRLTPLRYCGLALFAIVAVKVFTVDLETLDAFYRIIAFIVLGMLLLLGSFLYLRFRDTFSVEPLDSAAGSLLDASSSTGPQS